MMLRLDDFEGRWTLQRTIDDRRSNQTGEFRGTAVFRPAGPMSLTYDEAGDMKFAADGPVFKAERKYHWHFGAGAVSVLFGDESPFHSFVPDGHASGTSHPCGDDLYNVTYDFRGWPAWTATWIVSGPRKDYTSVSRYVRP